MRIIGLTGRLEERILVAALLREKYDIPVVNVALVAAKITAFGTNGLKRIVETFGEECLNSNSTLNRRYVIDNLMEEDGQPNKELNKIIIEETSKVVEKGIQELADAGVKIVIVSPAGVTNNRTYEELIVIHNPDIPNGDLLATYLIKLDDEFTNVESEVERIVNEMRSNDDS